NSSAALANGSGRCTTLPGRARSRIQRRPASTILQKHGFAGEQPMDSSDLAAELESAFPRLEAGSYRIVGTADSNYNCIAWAAGETHRWWWVHPRAYWPEGMSRELTLESFLQIFGSMGYEACEPPSLEEGFE